MDFLNIKKQILEISNRILLERISFEELSDYLFGLDIEDIDGELIRSYFIVYKNGIIEIWNNLILENKDVNLDLEPTVEMKILIEEVLEEVDFDKIFNSTLKAIKSR